MSVEVTTTFNTDSSEYVSCLDTFFQVDVEL